MCSLHAGDATTGTLYFNRAGDPGEADAAMMNTVCFDAMTLGNHEFDKGDSGLKRFIDLLHKGACQTPVLSANVTFGANSALNPSRAPGLVKPSIVLQRDGQSIGLVGLTIANKTQQSSSPDPGTVFGETAAAQQQIDALRAQGVNKIIVMSHIGYDYDKQIIPNLSGVDVVVGGDSHTLLGPAGMAGYGVGSPAGAYPTEVKNKDGKRVCLVQAWEYSQVVGELKVSFDANGDVTACAGTPHVLMGSAYKIGGAAVSPADQAAIAADIKASGFLYPQEPDAGALAVLQPFKAKVDTFSASQVAKVPQELCSRRVPGGRLARLQPVRRGLQHAGQRQPARRRHPAAGSPGLPGSGQRQLRRRRHLAAKRRRRARAAQGHRHGGQCDRGGALRQHAVAPERDRRRGQEHAGRRHAGGLRPADRPVHTRTRAACASTSTPRSRKAAGYPTSRSTTPPRPHGVRWTPAARTSSSC